VNLTPYQRPEVIRKVLGQQKIAIVGLSSNELRASNFVGRYLQNNGYEIFPVNPREERILGRKSFASLSDIPEAIATVDVFRHSSAVPDIAREAVAIGAKCLWLQYGVINEEGIEIAGEGGLDVVVDCCMKVEHARYLGRMHWLGFNTGRITAKRASGDL
jgi:predicted CoA-binding protein